MHPRVEHQPLMCMFHFTDDHKPTWLWGLCCYVQQHVHELGHTAPDQTKHLRRMNIWPPRQGSKKQRPQEDVLPPGAQRSSSSSSMERSGVGGAKYLSWPGERVMWWSSWSRITCWCVEPCCSLVLNYEISGFTTAPASWVRSWHFRVHTALRVHVSGIPAHRLEEAGSERGGSS